MNWFMGIVEGGIARCIMLGIMEFVAFIPPFMGSIPIAGFICIVVPFMGMPIPACCCCMAIMRICCCCCGDGAIIPPMLEIVLLFRPPALAEFIIGFFAAGAGAAEAKSPKSLAGGTAVD